MEELRNQAEEIQAEEGVLPETAEGSQEVRERKFRTYPFCVISLGVFCFVSLCVLFLLHLCGVAELFDGKVTLISVFDLIFEINFSAERVLHSLIGLGIAVLFCVTTVLMAIRLTRSGRDLYKLVKAYTKGKEEKAYFSDYTPSGVQGIAKEKREVKAFYALNTATHCLISFGILLFYTAFVYMAGGTYEGNLLIPAAVLSGAVFLLRGVMMHYEKLQKLELTDFIPDICKDAIVYIGALLIAYFLQREGLIMEIFVGLRMLFTGTLISFHQIRQELYAFYLGLADPILYLVMVIFLLNMLMVLLRFYERRVHLNWYLSRILILLLVIIVCNIVFACISGGIVEGAEIFQLLWERIQQILAPLIVSAVLILLFVAYKNKRFLNESEENEG